MQRFFESVLEPIFKAEGIKTIVEIGADKGYNTAKLIRYANSCKGKIYSIDPVPGFDSDTWEKENPDTFVMVKDLSLNAIKDIKDADCFLIDGDHNWYTVYHELKMIYDTYGDEKFPLVFFHDILWPYDRRDLYYSPDNIPAIYLNEYEKKAMKPGCDELCNDGINERLSNAKKYGGEKNGVLTAVEDFVRDYPSLGLKFMAHDVLFGLGMIAADKRYPEAIKHFYSAEALKGTMKVCERERLDRMVEVKTLIKKINAYTNAEKRNQIAKFYPDFGEGYSESTAVFTGEYDAESGYYYGKVVFDRPPVSVRFDPVNESYCVLSDLSIITSSGRLEPAKTNGKCFNGTYVFTTTDPQIIFENKCNSREFKIKAQICPFKNISAAETIIELLESNNSIAASNVQLSEENISLSREVSMLSDENKNLISAKNELLKANSTLLSERNNLQNEKNSSSKQLSSLNQQVSSLKESLKKTELSFNDAKKKNSALAEEVKKEKKSASDANAALQQNKRIAQQLYKGKKKIGWKHAAKSVFSHGLFATRTNIKAIKEISKNGGFDPVFYYAKNKDVLEKGIDPLMHFMWFGGYEGRNPSEDFDTKKYLARYADVKNSKVNPYAHYLVCGKSEKRKTFPVTQKNNAPSKDISSLIVKEEIKSSSEKAKTEEISIDPTQLKFDIISENCRLINEQHYSIKGNPLVSIIIINHNGLNNLKILFKSFKEKTFYLNFEIILVDNASTDESLAFIKSLTEYNITIIANDKNESFSKANNQGLEIAKGEYVLFLNNDVEVTDYWLDCLIHTAQEYPDSGAVGSRLVYPYIPEGYMNHSKSFKTQHFGIVYQNSSFEDEYFIRPINYKNGDEPLLGKLGYNKPFAVSGVTAACMLVKKSILDEIGGYDEEYVYGYEDCDLNLAILRKGYTNYLCPHSLLFHYEFGTQSSSTREEIVKRRTNNIHHFKEKWQEYLSNMMWKDKLFNTSEYIGCGKTLTIAVVVTDDDPNTSAGDYFTGMELCTALNEMGYKTKFLALKKDNCYDIGEDTDVLISLLEKFDLTKMKNYSSKLITIAWARNWFDRWCALPYIDKFTHIFASSRTACNFMKDILKRDIELFPIATNEKRFNNENTTADSNSPYYSDYVFTGSYWGAPREIIDFIEPDSLPYNFKIFGANWDKIPKFSANFKGFVNYNEMPDIYRNTRIVIDDANHVTKPYGAVNSRVFDALAAGRLVVTNGVIGANETFEGLLPYFETKEEFNQLIDKYLSDEAAYKEKVSALRQFVLENHTYKIRARQLIEFLKKKYLPDEKKIAIMMPVPKYIEAESWGDYHFGVALKKQFERNGFSVEMRILPEWDMPFDGKYVLVLRGLSVYKPKKQHINIMWNISHPDDIAAEEYNAYDMVYVSSEKWAKHLSKELKTNVDVLMQCTDEEVFYPTEDNEHKYQLLFVGNSRKIYRKIIKDLLPTKYDLAIFGTNWNQYVDSSYIKGENIPNKELSKAYSSCDILLNDHWDDMREKGFVSNRIYDGLASGTFIITDEIEDLDDDLKECVAFYKNKGDLAEKISYYMENPEIRKAMSKKGMQIVREKHTFKNRAEKIIHYIDKYCSSK